VTRRARVVAAGLVLAASLPACGKKGNPLPPLRPVPGRIVDFSATRVDNRVELQFTVPAANADGTTPAAIERVEIYRATATAGATPPAAPDLIAAKYLRAELEVEPREPGAPVAPAGGLPGPPAPGDRASFVDRIGPPADASWSYVVVGVAGRGRRGVPSAMATVPLGDLPPPPESLTTSHTDATLTLSWKGGGPQYRVFGLSSATDASGAKELTPAPIAAAEYTQPVEFGRERCFVVRTVQVSGAATVEGAPSSVHCVTPVDRYPPPVPANLQTIQEGGAVTLNWTAVEAPDLAGYVVLRGDAAGERMEPLMREPVRETTFKDTTVQPGGIYTYTVYAVDNAPTPNVSQQSNRQVVTVR
jgi:hypothetical protein